MVYRTLFNLVKANMITIHDSVSSLKLSVPGIYTSNATNAWVMGIESIE